MGGVGQPKIFVDENIYRMYYLNYSFPSPVSYAESNDGKTWTRPLSSPIIVVGPSGSWDDGGTGPGPVYKANGKYYMLYQGYDASTKHFQVGLASSTDGKNWVKYPRPIFSDSLDWEYNIVASDVELIDSIFYMYYSSGGKIGLATSFDGINWLRYSSSPILTATKSWESGGVSFPSVYKDGDVYKMIYMSNHFGYSGIGFGMAVSSDGKNWIKDNANPIFKKEHTTHKWASGGIVYPYALKIGDEQRIYYTGVTSSGEWKIGYTFRK